MLTIEWLASDGWQKPHIGPFKNLSVHPASSALHYAVEAAETVIELASMFKEKPDPSNLVFGTAFTDHMLTIEWSASDGWQKPHIGPFKNLSVHPASSALHYAVELFEGLKAYRGVDNNIRLFRPLNNMERMLRSACRAGLPSFDKEELLKCIKKLVEIEKAWVPNSSSASLYIRPTLIGTEPSLGVKKPSQALLYVILSPVGPYFSTGSFSPVSLWADPKYTRAWRGGTGDCKMGGNYDEELATPPLDGVILPGVTRQSIIDLAHEWGEFKVTERYLTMGDLTAALKENRVKEMFGAGTACIVCPVGRILYKGNVRYSSDQGRAQE
ncbi:UNVERIFIED_CONTAM: hypothetical protein FKN15_057923 [Acipenser sinensis]